MRRHRHAKIVATLGPVSSEAAALKALFTAGVDVFRLNCSHGTHADHLERIRLIRELEQTVRRPIGILLDLQGPKLRVGQLHGGAVELVAGETFRLDLKDELGDDQRVQLPHPEIFQALQPNAELLLDDGKLRLRVIECDGQQAVTEVVVGGVLADRKGVNVPDTRLPLSAITPKDERDLAFGLAQGVDWIALSFVQTEDDVQILKAKVAGRAGVMAKLEKPSAIQRLEPIVEAADAVMVARGDLGVEMPPEDVPGLQRRIVKKARKYGKPVVVATQMLESMIYNPTPTRAEASDVATAIYDGADAVMLSAETASGKYPVEAVQIMNRIISRTEHDESYRVHVTLQKHRPATAAAAICAALSTVAQTIPIAATVAYTRSGGTGLHAARERPASPILALTPSATIARRLSVVWGIHAVVGKDCENTTEMVQDACRMALHEGFGQRGQWIVITAGIPFGTPGATNLLRIAILD